MGRINRTHSPDRHDTHQDFRQDLVAMEDDLRILHGALASLRLMGWSHQPAEPAALAFLSRFAGDALERLQDSWKAWSSKQGAAVYRIMSEEVGEAAGLWGRTEHC